MSSDQEQRCIAEAVHATSQPKFLNAFMRPSGAITPDCQSGRPGNPDNIATDDSACHPASLVLLSHSDLQWTLHGKEIILLYSATKIWGWGGLAYSDTNDYKSVTKERNLKQNQYSWGLISQL